MRAFLVAIVVVVAGCSTGQGPQAVATPTAPPPSYNVILGNNRTAAEASIKVGRALWAQQQYWEVKVHTDPATLAHDYDPRDPASFTGAARQVTHVDLTIATESRQATQAYGLGGVDHEKAELTGVARLVQSLFPAATEIDFKVLYGELNTHATATYRSGQLDYHVLAPG